MDAKDCSQRTRRRTHTDCAGAYFQEKSPEGCVKSEKNKKKETGEKREGLIIKIKIIMIIMTIKRMKRMKSKKRISTGNWMKWRKKEYRKVKYFR